jgi:hypothetical protein
MRTKAFSHLACHWREEQVIKTNFYEKKGSFSAFFLKSGIFFWLLQFLSNPVLVLRPNIQPVGFGNTVFLISDV